MWLILWGDTVLISDQATKAFLMSLKEKNYLKYKIIIVVEIGDSDNTNSIFHTLKSLSIITCLN